MGNAVCYYYRGSRSNLLFRGDGTGIPSSMVSVLFGFAGSWICLGGLDGQEAKDATMACLGCRFSITLAMAGAAYLGAAIVLLAVLRSRHLHWNHTLAAEGFLLCSVFWVRGALLRA